MYYILTGQYSVFKVRSESISDLFPLPPTCCYLHRTRSRADRSHHTLHACHLMLDLPSFLLTKSDLFGITELLISSCAGGNSLISFCADGAFITVAMQQSISSTLALSFLDILSNSECDVTLICIRSINAIMSQIRTLCTILRHRYFYQYAHSFSTSVICSSRFFNVVHRLYLSTENSVKRPSKIQSLQSQCNA